MHIPPNRIVIYGKGAGCGISLYLAYKLTRIVEDKNDTYAFPAGMILVEPIINFSFGFKELVNKSKVKKIITPAIVVVGTDADANESIVQLYKVLQSQQGFYSIESDKNFEVTNTDDLFKCICQILKELFKSESKQFDAQHVESKIQMKPKCYTNPKDQLTAFLKPYHLDHLVDTMISNGYTGIDILKTMTMMDIQTVTQDEKEQKELETAIKNLRDNGYTEVVTSTTQTTPLGLPKAWTPLKQSREDRRRAGLTFNPNQYRVNLAHNEGHTRHLSFSFMHKETRNNSTFLTGQ